MATEPQTNPSETDPLLDKYNKFKNRAQAFQTAVETKREQAQMKKQMENSKNMQEMFKNIPTLIYIG